MSYHIYTTAAFVCGAVDQNQSDRAYLLFTDTLGMVWATARSVREERSRQRYALQPFSKITVSLIRGKTGWRIGSVVPDLNFYQLATDRAQRTAISQLFKLTRQYVHGEEANHQLFQELQQGCHCVLHSDNTPPDHIVLISTVRMLQLLGYVATPYEISTRLQETMSTSPLLPSEIQVLEEVIKTASTASHLPLSK